MTVPAHGDQSRYTTADLSTAYRKKRISTDRKLDAARKAFANAVNGLERLIENTSNAYAITPDEVGDFIRGARMALDEIEALHKRHGEGKARGWRW